MKKYLVLLKSITLIAIFVYTRRQDLLVLPHYLARINAGAVAVLLFLEAANYTVLARSNQLVYLSLGVRTPLMDQAKLLLASGTIERLLPSAGAAGMSSFVWLARNKGIDVADSVKMTATSFVMGYAQIIPLLFIPLFFIDATAFPAQQARLLVGVSAGFVLLVIGGSALLGIGPINSLLQKWPLLARYPRILTGIGAAHRYLQTSWRNRRRLASPLLLLWALYPLRAGMIWTCFAAFGSPVSWVLIWVGYSLTILISFLTFLPTTLGVFELSMVGTFTLLGVSSELATAVTLLYRAFTYWLPVPFGLLAWWNLRRKTSRF